MHRIKTLKSHNSQARNQIQLKSHDFCHLIMSSPLVISSPFPKIRSIISFSCLLFLISSSFICHCTFQCAFLSPCFAIYIPFLRHCILLTISPLLFFYLAKYCFSLQFSLASPIFLSLLFFTILMSISIRRCTFSLHFTISLSFFFTLSSFLFISFTVPHLPFHVFLLLNVRSLISFLFFCTSLRPVHGPRSAHPLLSGLGSTQHRNAHRFGITLFGIVRTGSDFDSLDSNVDLNFERKVLLNLLSLCSSVLSLPVPACPCLCPPSVTPNVAASRSCVQIHAQRSFMRNAAREFPKQHAMRQGRCTERQRNFAKTQWSSKKRKQKLQQLNCSSTSTSTRGS